jgi:site-specific DNA-methyltransferase (adenine-specific)
MSGSANAASRPDSSPAIATWPSETNHRTDKITAAKAIVNPNDAETCRSRPATICSAVEVSRLPKGRIEGDFSDTRRVYFTIRPRRQESPLVPLVARRSLRSGSTAGVGEVACSRPLTRTRGFDLIGEVGTLTTRSCATQGASASSGSDDLRPLIVQGDNLAFLRSLDAGTVNLIYIDPPFNTGKRQTRRTVKASATAEAGGHLGFGGTRYRRDVVREDSFADAFDDFGAFLLPRLEEAYRVLAPDGSLFVHLDPRESHYTKIWLDQIFGRESFINEIIWAYDFGGRSRTRWSSKHDVILWFAKNPKKYTFDFDAMDRIPYMAPGLVGPEKARRGKTPTDTWWHTIVPTSGREKTGYPTQKPLGIVERIVKIFAGSGTLGVAAVRNGRRSILVDIREEAVRVMQRRLASAHPRILTTDEVIGARPPSPLRGGGAVGATPGFTAQGRVSVIAAAVSKYQNLQDLPGADRDAALVRAMFETSDELALYGGTTLVLANPRAEELRTAVLDYATSRSARGDVLVFYFSGHGCVLGETEFGFCTTDSQKSDDGSMLPLSVVGFRDIVRTLAAVDVHPVFIVDACFSGAMITAAMQDSLHQNAGAAYAFLCSSYEATPSIDTSKGGAFTTALHDAARAGRSDPEGKRHRYLMLKDLSGPVQDALGRAGNPLSRCYLGPDLPSIPIVKNVGYQPLRYLFSSYFDTLIEYLWNSGDPRPIKVKDIAEKIGNGAYGNHRKLSLPPWDLVEDGANAGARQLTARGKRYACGKLSIPQVIEQDPSTKVWRAADNCDHIRKQ